MSGSYNYLTWSGITDNGVRYKLVSSTGQSQRDSTSVTEVILIRSVDLLNFILVSFPPSPSGNTFAAIYSNRALPQVPSLRTKSISWKTHVDGKPIDPFLADPTAPDGTYHPVLEVTITYDNEMEEQDSNDPDTYLEIRGSTAGEFLQIDAAESVWQNADGTTEANDNPNGIYKTVVVPTTEWTVTWTQIPKEFFRNTLMPRLRAITGKVNSDTNELLFDAAPETLLFAGFEYKEERKRFTDYETLVGVDPDTGETTQEVIRKAERFITLTAKFLEKHITLDDETIVGHNYYWKDGTGWKRLLIDNKPPYESAAFADVFNPEEDD